VVAQGLQSITDAIDYEADTARNLETISEAELACIENWQAEYDSRSRGGDYW
jgi:hypothetical protein